MASVGLEIQAPKRGAFETLGLKMRNAEGLNKVKVFGVAFFSALAALFTAPAALRGINVFERLVTYAYPERAPIAKDKLILESEAKAKNIHNGREVQVSSTVDLNDASILRLQFEGGREVEVLTGRHNIFHSKASTIVNPANTHLGTSNNRGLNREIIRDGGDAYQRQHVKLREKMDGKFRPGDAAILNSGELGLKLIRSVIVVAPPKGSATSEKKKQLFACYYNAFQLAEQSGNLNIAVPSLGTGVNGFPPEMGAKVCLQAIQAYYKNKPDSKLRISIYARKPEEFNAFKNKEECAVSDVEIEGFDELPDDEAKTPEELAELRFKQNAPHEIGLLIGDLPCSSNLPMLYNQYLQIQHPKEKDRFYFAEGFVKEDLDESVDAIPNNAELIFIPLGIEGKGMRAALTPQEKRQFVERHCASFTIRKPQGDEPGKIYYFEPKGYRFHEDLMTVEGLSVQTVYNKLAEKFPGYELVQYEGGVQAFSNKKDCVVHVTLRMEEHLEALLENREPNDPQPVDLQVRSEVASRIKGLLPPVDGGSNREGNVDLDESFSE